MDLLRHRLFRILCALFVAFVVVGDIVADSIHDASGQCVSESQSSGHDDCAICTGCTIHNGCAVAPDMAFARPIRDVSASESFSVTDDRPAPAAAAEIDHPPQLS